MRLKSVVREPLLHFLLLGAALFAFSQWIGTGSTNSSNRIVLTAGQIDQLVAGYTKTWKRPPTDVELKAMIDDWVREELAVRSALDAGLERGDVVIRRRLRQKFEFFVEDMSELTPTTDAELREWFSKNAGSYRAAGLLQFRQIYFNKERRGAAVHDDAAAALKRLAHGGADAQVAGEGDASLLPQDVGPTSILEVDRIFGDGFAERLNGVAIGNWAGPIASAYGVHLVLVRGRVQGALPDFAAARASVERDFTTARRKQQLDAAYEILLKKFSVVLETPEGRGFPSRTGKAGP